MSVTNKTLVYINGHAEIYLTDPLIKEYLNDKLGTKDWKICSNNVKDIPDVLAGMLTPEFLHGVSAAHYLDVRKGGIFINPFVPGMTVEYELWAEVIFEEDFMPNRILFIDVPYALYEMACPNNLVVDEDAYKKNNEYTEKLVGLLNEQYPPDRTLH